MNFIFVILSAPITRITYTPFANPLTSIFLMYFLPASQTALFVSSTFLPSIVNMATLEVPVRDGT